MFALTVRRAALEYRRLNMAPAGIAQLVERNLAKVEVEGSSPFSRSSFDVEPRVPNPGFCTS